MNDGRTTPAVLVTGAAGYIGSHCCKALAAAGYRPVAVDNLSRGYREAIKWGPFEHADISDRGRMGEIIALHNPIAVIHFAAFAYVGESSADPALYYSNNVAGTLSLLETMRAGGVDKIVFSSTCATYGAPDVLPIAESTVLAPINPYGRSKLMVEAMIRDYANAYDLRWTSLRYFNAAGADPEGEIGENHDPETHLIPLTIAAAEGDIANIQVFGADYDTPDGTCIRDFVHVSDLAHAHVLALQRLERGAFDGAFNLGSAQGHSVLEVVAAVGRSVGRSPPIIYAPRRAGDPPSLVADATLASRELGWAPKYVSIEEMVFTAHRWYKKRRKV